VNEDAKASTAWIAKGRQLSIQAGWSEPVPGQELHPLKSSAFTAHFFAKYKQNFSFWVVAICQ